MTRPRFFKDEDGYDSIWFDEDDQEDFTLDFSRYLASGETISSATVTTEDNITISNVSNTTTTVTFWLSGDPNSMSEVVVQITTDNTPARKRSRTIRVYEREG